MALLAGCLALIILGVFSGFPGSWWWSLILAGALAWLATIDVEKLLLPDLLTLPLLCCGLMHAGVEGKPELVSAVSGAVVGYVALAAVGYVFERVRGVKGIGGGDAKLLAAGGAWLGWMGLPVVVLTASLAGLAFAALRSSKLQRAGGAMVLPFGPFLAGGIWLGWCLIQRN